MPDAGASGINFTSQSIIHHTPYNTYKKTNQTKPNIQPYTSNLIFPNSYITFPNYKKYTKYTNTPTPFSQFHYPNHYTINQQK